MASLNSLRRKLPLADTVDLYFLLLRFLTVAGGAGYYFFTGSDYSAHQVFVRFFPFYLLYSGLLYAAIFRWPGAIRAFYLIALVADMLFIFLLILFVGLSVGSFFIAFYLLAAIHAFYFGLRVGLGAALAASLLYGYAYLVLDGPSLIPWPDFFVRVAFLFLIALSLGLLAQREKQARRTVEALNLELARKNSVLEQAYRHLSIGKLVGEISASINSPCGILAARSEVLTQEAKERELPPEFIKGLEVIKRCSYQVAQVTRTLSVLSKQKSFEMKSLDLNQLIEENLLMMERGLTERGIKVATTLAPRLPPIWGDAYELKGVLINLLSNAMDALPQGGAIDIATRLGSADERSVECIVTDNGAGIPEENLDKIFNPFFTTKQDTGGIGLGLSTSLGVLKKHNGIITVKSRLGQGSSFSFSLPAHRP